MLQVDKKALYIDYTKDYTIIKSYATPIIFLYNGKLYTTNTKYSTTTSRHKNYIMKEYQEKNIIIIPQKVFNNTMYDIGVSLGIA